MLRFITFLLGREYEECKSCQTLKEQLSFEREEKKRLTETLLNILNPKAVEAAPVVMNPINEMAGSFTRRRAALEARDREEAKILSERKHLGVPDVLRHNEAVSNINELEQQLGIDTEKEVG